jgi:hypothetical protein
VRSRAEGELVPVGWSVTVTAVAVHIYYLADEHPVDYSKTKCWRLTGTDDGKLEIEEKFA